MKYAWIFLLSLLPLFSIAQWTEDFSSTNALSTYPNADTENYVINTYEQLQLNASLPGFSQLQFPLSSTNNAWEFSCFIRQSFAGSTNNFGRLLLSINADADSGGYSGSTSAVIPNILGQWQFAHAFGKWFRHCQWCVWTIKNQI
jgi:hypothetical protein